MIVYSLPSSTTTVGTSTTNVDRTQKESAVCVQRKLLSSLRPTLRKARLKGCVLRLLLAVTIGFW